MFISNLCKYVYYLNTSIYCTVGSWLHCGYHLTTAIVAPALLSLPFALALLGWGRGMVVLALAGIVTFYSYNLLSLVLEHHAALGHRQLRFRDMAHDILGNELQLYPHVTSINKHSTNQPNSFYRPRVGPVLRGPTSVGFVLWCCHRLYSSWRPESQGWLISFFVSTNFLIFFVCQIFIN